mmetsp:Transcript_9364/g.14041  ORF Transcript_9364/g.14041 Transcript_9364/m.14041 type:complete len:323 (+) Transcript_9364:124-1092(+)
MIEASANGKKFAVKIPDYLGPGQYFTVRVPQGESAKDEKMKAAPPDIQYNLEPNFVVGNDKYFKEVKTCNEWCDCSRLCFPYVRFSGKKDSIIYKHDCCCLPCCCSFSVYRQESKDGKKSQMLKIGEIAPPGCSDQKLMAVVCPCCYTGPYMQAKFMEPNGNKKFSLQSTVECCQYACLCLQCFSPCFRCIRFCCSANQYTKYEQNIYNGEVEDNASAVARVIYTERMICPCIPDERVQMRIEPTEDTELSKDDLVLLSLFPTLITGYTYFEFCLPLSVPFGIGFSLPTPTGIEAVDNANNIQFEHMTIQEALETRQENDMS